MPEGSQPLASCRPGPNLRRHPSSFFPGCRILAPLKGAGLEFTSSEEHSQEWLCHWSLPPWFVDLLILMDLRRDYNRDARYGVGG
jgi:hypothetical protein